MCAESPVASVEKMGRGEGNINKIAVEIHRAKVGEEDGGRTLVRSCIGRRSEQKGVEKKRDSPKESNWS